MLTFITNLAIGLLICIIGIINMTGNISMLHSYHRQRVTEENKKPFGRLVGLGLLIVGISIIAFGILMLIFDKTQIDVLVIIGNIELFAGIAIGMIVTFYAMKKYNHGIF